MNTTEINTKVRLFLTNREKDYLRYALFQQKEIAAKLNVAPSTVKTTVRNIAKKFQTTSLPAAAVVALKQGRIKIWDIVIPGAIKYENNI